MKKIILKEDLVIPKGTIFESCDNTTVEFCDGNFNALIGVNKNSVMNIYIDDESVAEESNKFEFID